jgi:hypothetical protein
MANHKTPGADGVPAELLKYSGPRSIQILLLLSTLIHDRECIPQEGRHAGAGAQTRGPYKLRQLPGPDPAPCYQQIIQQPAVAAGEPACRANRSPVILSVSGKSKGLPMSKGLPLCS